MNVGNLLGHPLFMRLLAGDVLLERIVVLELLLVDRRDARRGRRRRTSGVLHTVRARLPSALGR